MTVGLIVGGSILALLVVLLVVTVTALRIYRKKKRAAFDQSKEPTETSPLLMPGDSLHSECICCVVLSVPSHWNAASYREGHGSSNLGSKCWTIGFTVLLHNACLCLGHRVVQPTGGNPGDSPVSRSPDGELTSPFL